MIPLLNNQTIKVLSVPSKLVVIEGSGGVPVSELDVVQFYREVKAGGDPYKTEYAKRFGSLFADGLPTGGGALRSRIDGLILDMESKDPAESPLPAKLNANGTFELLDGHHRSGGIVANGGDEIPIAVKYVSPMWTALCDRLLSIYGNKKLYQSIDHPWFDDWTVARSPQRAKAIVRYLDGVEIERRNCLDIGCCTGGLSRALQTAGWSTYGFDVDQNVISIADQLNLVFGSNVNFTVFGDIEKMVCGCGLAKTNVVVCLSVMHHYLWAGNAEKYAECLTTLLSNCKVLIWDHFNNEDRSKMKTDKIPFEVDNYIQWVRDTMGVQIQLIGRFEDRPLFAYVC